MNTRERDELIDHYAQLSTEQMDLDDLLSYVRDCKVEWLGDKTDDEIRKMIVDIGGTL